MSFQPRSPQLELVLVESDSASAAPGDEIEVRYRHVPVDDADFPIDFLTETKIAGQVVDRLDSTWTGGGGATIIRTITLPSGLPVGETQICVTTQTDNGTQEICIDFTVLGGQDDSRMVIDDVVAEPAPTPNRTIARVTARNEILSGSGRPLTEVITIEGYGDTDEEEVTLSPGETTTFERLLQETGSGRQEVCASVGGRTVCESDDPPGDDPPGDDPPGDDPVSGGGRIDPAVLAIGAAGVAFVVWRSRQ